ncbi:MAG: hypothetical protein R2941_02480 [Desulfobacterales bacterium]
MPDAFPHKVRFLRRDVRRFAPNWQQVANPQPVAEDANRPRQIHLWKQTVLPICLLQPAEHIFYQDYSFITGKMETQEDQGQKKRGTSKIIKQI